MSENIGNLIAKEFDNISSTFKVVGEDIGKLQVKTTELFQRVNSLEKDRSVEKLVQHLESLVLVGKTIAIVIAFTFGWFIVKEWLKWIH